MIDRFLYIKCSTASGRRRRKATGPRRSEGSGTGSAPSDEEYYRIQRELLKDGLTRKAKLTQLPPHEEGQPTLWAIGIEGPSPLRLPEASQYPLHVSLAFDDELSDQQKRDLERDWGEARDTTLHFHKFTSGAAGELSLKWDPVANSESVQRARESSYYGCTSAFSKDGGAQKQRLSRQAQLRSGPRLHTGGRAA